MCQDRINALEEFLLAVMIRGCRITTILLVCQVIIGHTVLVSVRNLPFTLNPPKTTKSDKYNLVFLTKKFILFTGLLWSCSLLTD